jgi:translocation and assembly module TamA
MDRDALNARRLRGPVRLWPIVAALGWQSAFAAHLELQIDGVEGPLRDAAVAAAGMQDYATRDITAAQAHRLYERAPKQIAAALEPYGYYNATADGEFKDAPTGYVAVIHVHLGEPTVVSDYAVVVPDPARD